MVRILVVFRPPRLTLIISTWIDEFPSEASFDWIHKGSINRGFLFPTASSSLNPKP